MKKITLTLLLLFSIYTSFSQDTEAPTVPDNLIIDHVIDYLYWDSSTDNVEVMEYDIYVNDAFRLTVTHLPNDTNFVNINHLGPIVYEEIYSFRILARDTSGNESAFSDYTSFVSPTPGTIYDPDAVFISRVMNGDNDYKGVEVLNTTGEIVDMSEYTLKLSYDGNSTWDITYTFPPNTFLNHFDKIRILHSQATPCVPQDFLVMDTNDVITNFDGNDAMGLFHNDVLIDRLGHLGQNTTYVEANQLAVRLFYTDQHSPWVEFEITSFLDICEGNLGEDYYTLSVSKFAAKNITVYPNPVKGNVLHFDTKNNQPLDTATIVDMTGKTVLTSANIINNQLDIQNITQGIYFVKIQSGDKISIHKMIRQ
ncbi:T9SS type A sorting domain-containing protein [uncultured Kordia sp.]|uniref:T9SS type A sorting domain-containing protein n=1 Tax=uncultured Kordia sp. TaxID=507699 RepID=UPI0026097FA3|nr:T9SS type A sorting domain-containing protein [uncultured Kordia sp.]